MCKWWDAGEQSYAWLTIINILVVKTSMIYKFWCYKCHQVAWLSRSSTVLKPSQTTAFSVAANDVWWLSYTNSKLCNKSCHHAPDGIALVNELQWRFCSIWNCFTSTGVDKCIMSLVSMYSSKIILQYYTFNIILSTNKLTIKVSWLTS